MKYQDEGLSKKINRPKTKTQFAIKFIFKFRLHFLLLLFIDFTVVFAFRIFVIGTVSNDNLDISIISDKRINK